MPEQNRQERRRQQFGGGRATEHGGWPTTQPNPALVGESDATPAADDAPASKKRPAPDPKPVADEPGADTDG